VDLVTAIRMKAMFEEMLSFPFFRRALLGGILVVITLSLLSFFVVLRRIAFMGTGISHSALAGVAIGLTLGINTTVSATIFCALIALLIGYISKKGRVREDVAIGITFSGTMALGVTLISLSGKYMSNLFSYLFGSILSRTPGDIVLMGFYCLVTATLITLFFRHLLLISFEESIARVAGVPVDSLHYMLLVLIAVVTVASIKLVGIILVSALLVLPAATARQLVRTYRPMLILSILVGLISLFTGLVLSYTFDLPSGATIVLCACALFFICFALSPRRRRKTARGG
jgi:ABC-type Mn2+/Zn2+ transport system permease subunit